jgi:DNA-directed RNA polymerase subunit M/transcription elongation factor TFIIS
MSVQTRRLTELRRFKTTNPMLQQLEWYEFTRCFPVELLYNVLLSPDRDPKNVNQNQLAVEYCAQFAHRPNWLRYHSNMTYWLQCERHDPQFFERYTLEQLVGSSPGYIAEPGTEPNVVNQSDVKREGLFGCPRCRSRNTEHTSVQTRRADEAATIFIFCHSCQHRWRR